MDGTSVACVVWLQMDGILFLMGAFGSHTGTKHRPTSERLAVIVDTNTLPFFSYREQSACSGVGIMYMEEEQKAGQAFRELKDRVHLLPPVDSHA